MIKSSPILTINLTTLLLACLLLPSLAIDKRKPIFEITDTSFKKNTGTNLICFRNNSDEDLVLRLSVEDPDPSLTDDSVFQLSTNQIRLIANKKTTKIELRIDLVTSGNIYSEDAFKILLIEDSKTGYKQILTLKTHNSLEAELFLYDLVRTQYTSSAFARKNPELIVKKINGLSSTGFHLRSSCGNAFSNNNSYILQEANYFFEGSKNKFVLDLGLFQECPNKESTSIQIWDIDRQILAKNRYQNIATYTPVGKAKSFYLLDSIGIGKNLEGKNKVYFNTNENKKTNRIKQAVRY